MGIDAETWSAIAAVGSAGAAGISAFSLWTTSRRSRVAGVVVRTIREIENGKPRSYFSILNLGPAIAREIEVRISGFAGSEQENILDFSPEGVLRIPYLAPGSDVRRPIHLVMGTDITKLISGQISWNDRKRHETSFEVPRMQ
jgi:hypothetical protein